MSEGDNQNRMRRGIVFSAILHVLLLIVVVVGLPRWHKPVEIAPAIPVEVVTLRAILNSGACARNSRASFSASSVSPTLIE